ncbi:hypothetical protein CAPTEDRAFT_98887, partial [Capitella teleta]
MTASKKPQFYRRTLPETCISFCSTEGKAIFKEAMLSGHMDGYFPLAAQFRTQDEPAYCGLSTLVMVLNALEVDPGRVWKGPWRWYHENMLECCTPLDIVERQGITMEQFTCLALCNTLSTTTVYVDQNTNVETFRETVMRCTRSEDEFIAVSYSRKILRQTGSGHFSTIGGYHKGRDLLLILDTARFKYPPHWVPLPLLFDAMKEIDPETQRPRGYLVLAKASTQPQMMFQLNPVLGV